MGLFGESFISDRFNNKKNAKVKAKAKPKPKPKNQECQWITPGQEVTIQGFKITKGNFYLGEKFLVRDQTANSYTSTYMYASVINESLPVSDESKYTTQFNSYNDMMPYHRYQYLEWLAGDTTSIPTSLDILSLHLTGLSLRMFFDAKTVDDERKAILRELIDIKRLLIANEYAMDYDIFDNLIDSAMTKFFSHLDPLLFLKSQELPSLKQYKVNILNEIFKINPIIECYELYVYAKRWVIGSEHDMIQEYDEFTYELFSTYFQKHHPFGFKANKTYSQSPTYTIDYLYIRGGKYTPEYINLNTKTMTLQFHIWDVNRFIYDCFQKVDRAFHQYYKALERNDGEITLEALCQLPEEIDISKNKEIKRFTDFLKGVFTNEKYALVDFDDILEQFDYIKIERTLPKRLGESIISTFDRLGYGIEPDYRNHGSRLNHGIECILFARSQEDPIKVNKIYSRTQAMIKMAVVLAQADDAINATEKEYIVNYIKTQTKDDAKVEQLTAYLEYLSLSKQKYNGFKKFPDFFSEKSIKGVDEFLLKLAFIDSDMNSDEIQALTKIMAYFNVESDDIHSRIHRMYTGEDTPITISKESGAKQYSIPKEKKKEFIDKAKLLKIEQDTVKSKQLLSEIFESEEEEEEKLPTKGKQQDKLMIILETLLSKESWSRKEVESLCAEHNMMLGSALEAINDYAYSIIDDAVIEDEGEIIYITTEYKDKLRC